MTSFNTRSSSIVKVGALIYPNLHNVFFLVFISSTDTIFHKNKKKFLFKLFKSSLVYENIYEIQKHFPSGIKLCPCFFREKILFASLNNIFVDMPSTKKRLIIGKSLCIAFINASFWFVNMILIMNLSQELLKVWSMPRHNWPFFQLS